MPLPINLDSFFKRNPDKKIEGERVYINPYMDQMLTDYVDWSLTENQAQESKSKWRKEVFNSEPETPLDLEIGTGNGFFFAEYALRNPSRTLVGLELKYKPLIQSIKRALDSGARNMRIARAHAEKIGDYFSDGELDRIFLHFPDPWPKRRHHKNRLINRAFLNDAFDLLKPGGFLEFKTDNLEYFEWALDRFNKSQFLVEEVSFDLHKECESQSASGNDLSDFSRGKFFRTHFEKLWTRKGLKIHYLIGRKVTN